jgi:hypothetical protein
MQPRHTQQFISKFVRTELGQEYEDQYESVDLYLNSVRLQQALFYRPCDLLEAFYQKTLSCIIKKLYRQA